ncbi:unnamed protein product [Caenorhabditis angaria]|uniref:BPTI/Kunitz inhibitor domain-containing protein n=1 Tax=Caenorhabditis angaria TaxID=860376 RepID=A0A9P1IT35_9PELO|nr:unnamed protein product [Caenorhabditis angaria]
MCGVLLLIFALIFSSSALVPDVCAPKLDLGCPKPNATQKSEIRWHFDPELEQCFAFKYTGCGGNSNNFNTQTLCEALCLAVDRQTCPANTKPSSTCEAEKDCAPSEYCKNRIMGSSICCSKEVRTKFEHNFEICPQGKQLVGQDFLGKSCKSNFCPENSTCHDGAYFAVCCK